MEGIFKPGDSWLDADGRVIVAVADVHGGRVSLCRPCGEETVAAAIARAKRKCPLGMVRHRRIDKSPDPPQN